MYSPEYNTGGLSSWALEDDKQVAALVRRAMLISDK